MKNRWALSLQNGLEVSPQKWKLRKLHGSYYDDVTDNGKVKGMQSYALAMFSKGLCSLVRFVVLGTEGVWEEFA